MAKQNKNNTGMNMPKPKTSMYWFYGLVILFILGWALFGQRDDKPLQSDWTTVEQMVIRGQVEKIQVVNRDQAEVFLKKEAITQLRNTEKEFANLPQSGSQLFFTIGSVDSFREDLQTATQQSGQNVPVVYENKDNGWSSFLINVLPWVVFIGIWFFVMRSMSRGGGAGGGIMNVGKAKAQVFDKDNAKRRKLMRTASWRSGTWSSRPRTCRRCVPRMTSTSAPSCRPRTLTPAWVWSGSPS